MNRCDIYIFFLTIEEIYNSNLRSSWITENVIVIHRCKLHTHNITVVISILLRQRDRNDVKQQCSNRHLNQD